MDRRARNIEIYRDTLEWIEKSTKLQEALEQSKAKQRVIREKKSPVVTTEGAREGKTVISSRRSFQAAGYYAREGKKVCVLNFASATNPGGGVENGSSAQEEALCRCSTLHPCLKERELWDEFYLPHRKAGNALYNDDCIYTPGVYVVKTDNDWPERMAVKDWFMVDVVTCAAPNLRERPSNAMNPYAGRVAAKLTTDELRALLVRRIDRIFRVTIECGNPDVLILGAFGCGAFCNPPKVVAQAFRDVQQKYAKHFDTIEYAIYCRESEMDNYDAFREVFGLINT